MLSRHASGIFWLARYLERADFTAKLARASINASPPDAEYSKKFMAAALLAIGERGNFERMLSSIPGLKESEFLFCCTGNPSSLISSAEGARKNIELSSSVLPPDMLLAVHGFLRSAKSLAKKYSMGESIDSELLSVRMRHAEAQGIADGFMSRSDAYEFWKTGRMVERMNGIARSVALGFNLASYFEIEGSSAREAFIVDFFANFANSGDLQRTCPGEIDDAAILHFLLLDTGTPTSLAFAVLEIERGLRSLGRATGNSFKSARLSKRISKVLRNATTDVILEKGIPEFARETIQASVQFANQIEYDFKFNS